MQILKVVEAQTKEMTYRQRMYVLFFLCGHPLMSVFCHPSFKHPHPPAVLAVFFSCNSHSNCLIKKDDAI